MCLGVRMQFWSQFIELLQTIKISVHLPLESIRFKQIFMNILWSFEKLFFSVNSKDEHRFRNKRWFVYFAFSNRIFLRKRLKSIDIWKILSWIFASTLDIFIQSLEQKILFRFGFLTILAEGIESGISKCALVYLSILE